jgi:ZIP family zinc transporter
VSRTLLFAVLASSPLVLGAYLGSKFTFPERLLAAVLAFAAGALITALTFELFEESYEKGGAVRAAVGLAAGAIVFTAASVVLDRYVADDDDPDGSAKLDKDAAAGDRRRELRLDERRGRTRAARCGHARRCAGERRARHLARRQRREPRPARRHLRVEPAESLVGAASMRAQGRSTAYAVGLWSVAAVLLSAASCWVLGRCPPSRTRRSRCRWPSPPEPSSRPSPTR